jgi:tight adherence protein C
MNVATGMSPMLLVLRLATAAAAAVTAGASMFAIASAPSRVATRLGLRGLKRQTALRSNEAWSTIEPVVRWLGVRLSAFLPDDTRATLDAQISHAGDYLGLTPEEYVALSVLTSLAGFAVGAVVGVFLEVGGMLTVMLAGVLGAMLPYLNISGHATERLKSISRGLPYTIDLMALAMSAGLDFPGAVRQVVEKASNPQDPIIEEFTLLLQGLNVGQTRKDALLQFARRAPMESVVEFVNALVQAEDRGNPVADMLVIQAGVSRQRRSTRAEEAASKAGVQMVIPLILVFVSVLGLLLGPALLGVLGAMR